MDNRPNTISNSRDGKTVFYGVYAIVDAQQGYRG